MDIVGWVERPRYDDQAHQLKWSISSKDKGDPDSADQGINYNTHALGREGFITMNLVTDMNSVEAHKPIAAQMLSGLNFSEGKLGKVLLTGGTMLLSVITCTKQLEVQIMGQSYLLGCPDGGQARLLAAVDKVDQAMCKVRDAGKIKARDRIAVLAALNLAFEQTDAQAATEADDGASTSPTQEASNASDNARLELLLKKLDQALHQDGQLI